MRKTRSFIEWQFSTFEDAKTYDGWFRAKVHAALADARPGTLTAESWRR